MTQQQSDSQLVDKIFGTPQTSAPQPDNTKPPPEFAKAMEKKVSVGMSGRGLDPTDIDQVQRLARMYLDSGMVPESIVAKTTGNTASARVCLILEYARVLGISNMEALRGMCVVRNTISIWGDLPVALVLKHPQFAGMKIVYSGEADKRVCTVTLSRKVGDSVVDIDGSFSIAQVIAAGLGNKDIYRAYTDDMLYRRAFSRASRRLFADALCGLGSAVELSDADATEEAARTAEAGSVMQSLENQ